MTSLCPSLSPSLCPSLSVNAKLAMTGKPNRPPGFAFFDVIWTYIADLQLLGSYLVVLGHIV